MRQGTSDPVPVRDGIAGAGKDSGPPDLICRENLSSGARACTRPAKVNYIEGLQDKPGTFFKAIRGRKRALSPKVIEGDREQPPQGPGGRLQATLR